MTQTPAKRTNIVWQTFDVLLVKHNVCRFCHDTNTCLTNIFCLWRAKMFFPQTLTSKMCLSSNVVVAKPASMLDKQSLKCLPNNVWPFGRGFTLSLYACYNLWDRRCHLNSNSHYAICSNNLKDLHVVTTSFLWRPWVRLVPFLRSHDATSVVCYELLLQIGSCKLAFISLSLRPTTGSRHSYLNVEKRIIRIASLVSVMWFVTLVGHSFFTNRKNGCEEILWCKQNCNEDMPK